MNQGPIGGKTKMSKTGMTNSDPQKIPLELSQTQTQILRLAQCLEVLSRGALAGSVMTTVHNVASDIIQELEEDVYLELNYDAESAAIRGPHPEQVQPAGSSGEAAEELPDEGEGEEAGSELPTGSC